jgi:hypothetical protein
MKPSPSSGRRLSLGSSRALVLDLLRLSQRVPVFPVERPMELAAVAAAREACPQRISWVVLFAKALSLTTREIPELRRSYITWPWPHLYECEQNVAMVTVNRQYGGEDRLFWLRLVSPETTPLTGLQKQLERGTAGDVEEVFRQQLQFSMVPAFLRRLIWWGRMNLWPSRRACWLGTFGLSVLASQGCYNRQPPHFLTSCLSYGPLDDRGRMPVTLICDHRVLDGVAAARAIVLLEKNLCGPIAAELRQLQGVRVAA